MLDDQGAVTGGSVTAELNETGEPPTELLAVRRPNNPLFSHRIAFRYRQVRTIHAKASRT